MKANSRKKTVNNDNTIHNVNRNRETTNSSSNGVMYHKQKHNITIQMIDTLAKIFLNRIIDYIYMIICTIERGLPAQGGNDLLKR